MKFKSAVNKYFFKLSFLFVFLNIFLSSWWLLHNNIKLNFDLSRDFMIWRDIVQNRHLTLIGGHSGTINGVFHGPLWYYINLPAFILGKGNPLAMGWFWILLSILSLIIIYYVAQKLFSRNIAILSTLLYSANSITNSVDDSKYFYNPYGAVMLYPLFFYFFYRYTNSLNPKILLLSLFILGAIIQFQMAFGIPILILTLIHIVFFTCKNKKFLHLFSLFILVLPFSTFILFEVRHNFIELHTILNYLTTQLPQSSNSWFGFVGTRLDSLFFDNFRMLIPSKWNYIIVIFSLIFFIPLFKILIKKETGEFHLFFLFSYFYFGFGFVTFFFWGKIVNYYWPFLPLLTIFFCGILSTFPKQISMLLFILSIIINMLFSLQVLATYSPGQKTHSFESWDYNYALAKTIYSDAKGSFGYYIFTPDLFGYNQRYAMEYTGREFPYKKGYAFTKKELTYLIEVYPPVSRPDLSPDSWKMSDVKLFSKPEKILYFKDYKIEKYLLSENQIKIPSNPYIFLINNLYFR